MSNLPKKIVKMMNSSRHHEYYLRVLLCSQKMEEEKVDFHEVVLGAFHLVKISGISGSAVNGTRFVGSSHWKIPRKSGKSKKVVRFAGLNFRTKCRVPFTFLVVCTSSRSTVGHRHVPGFTTKWNNFLPIGNSTFATTEISGFFS